MLYTGKGDNGTIKTFGCLTVSIAQAGDQRIPKEPHVELLAYLNRLSSLLYALARLANYRAGAVEAKPHY